MAGRKAEVEYDKTYEDCDHSNAEWVESHYGYDSVEEELKCPGCGAHIFEEYHRRVRWAGERDTSALKTTDQETDVMKVDGELRGFDEDLRLFTETHVERVCDACEEPFEDGEETYFRFASSEKRFCKSCARKDSVIRAL